MAAGRRKGGGAGIPSMTHRLMMTKKWRIAVNGYRRLTMVVVGCRTMTAWNTTTTPRGGGGPSLLDDKDGRAGEVMGDDGDGSRGAPPLPPPKSSHPWHDDRGVLH